MIKTSINITDQAQEARVNPGEVFLVSQKSRNGEPGKTIVLLFVLSDSEPIHIRDGHPATAYLVDMDRGYIPYTLPWPSTTLDVMGVLSEWGECEVRHIRDCKMSFDIQENLISYLGPNTLESHRMVCEEDNMPDINQDEKYWTAALYGYNAINAKGKPRETKDISKFLVEGAPPVPPCRPEKDAHYE
jgi:hypothetical protein